MEAGQLALGLALELKGDVQCLFQELETAVLDFGEVGEQIVAPLVRGDKAEALGIVEPFTVP
jgi:hypothetical protein